MEYFIIDDIDFSMYVSELIINSNTLYNQQTNANGDSVIDYINKKRTIEVNIIPVDKEAMYLLQSAINSFNVSISFLSPETGEIEQDVQCIIPASGVEYYTIQANKTLYKALRLTFIEL